MKRLNQYLNTYTPKIANISFLKRNLDIQIHPQNIALQITLLINTFE